MDQVYRILDKITVSNSFLQLSGMNLTTLDGIENHPNFNLVTRVNCTNNNLTALPLWPNVTYVYCSYNQLRLLPLWPNVTEVYTTYNNITTLPLWKNVIIVNCSFNPIISLPLWPNVINVECAFNKLITLPLWPKLKVIYCHHNNLAAIPLWPNIIHVGCSDFIDLDTLKGLSKIKNVLMKHILNKHLAKIAVRIHERKWRNVNAEIVCRPITGQCWKQFINHIETMI